MIILLSLLKIESEKLGAFLHVSRNLEIYSFDDSSSLSILQ